MPYKRFLLFYLQAYYPCGGEGDVEGSFDTLAEALAHIEAAGTNGYEWWEVLDMDAREFVYPQTE